MDSSFIFYNGRDGDRTERTLRRSQVSVQRLAMIYKLDVTSVYITEEFGSSEFPNPDGTFDCLRESPSGTYYQVEGEPHQGMTQVRNLPTSTVNDIGAFRRPTMLHTSSSTMSRKRVGAAAENYVLKVVLADIENKKIVNQKRISFITITEAEANVDAITEMAKTRFEDRTLVLVQGGGLRYEDSAATRGISFWKAAARKVYAVKANDLETFDYFTPRRTSTQSINFEEIKEKLADLTSLVQSGVILTCVDQDTREAAQRALSSVKICEKAKQSFECLICRGLSRSPVKMGSCCRRIIGCGECVDRWFLENQNCPHCRSNELDAIFETNNFDGVLAEIRSVFPN
ncbi:uncharacterized protein LOC130636029 [Hydractinia symbiolongicarpus]|uniref:uncharacterized protein LOC130621525 n=1 Tax=Hydractinia symbiolongicarpus TaxID=13093 RepID=UPI00254CC229|nr:uncharacterized protein LOC130621525 [Hydractinia symbiolongicarpus]XP_057292814.1 uncharacterized protein LOC130621527 [Hydractinia symbiolongicarpus]XP_057297134.1 uncharacterized protein LOC130626041 [Hydractinia symbiolongicarpus]XP_057301591.1 uncharacterized protein LOC130636029 [Hydractinia symbiolongicarpus]